MASTTVSVKLQMTDCPGDRIVSMSPTHLRTGVVPIGLASLKSVMMTGTEEVFVTLKGTVAGNGTKTCSELVKTPSPLASSVLVTWDAERSLRSGWGLTLLRRLPLIQSCRFEGRRAFRGLRLLEG